MAIYRVSVDMSDSEEISATFEFCKLGNVVYNGRYRDVYVSAPNENQAIKKGLRFVKKFIEEEIGD